MFTGIITEVGKVKSVARKGGAVAISVDAPRIAPELGVTESRAFVSCLRATDMGRLAEDFIELAYNSKKRKKWMRARW